MEKINFKDSPSTETPLSTRVLNLMQDNIESEIDNLSTTYKGTNITAETIARNRKNKKNVWKNRRNRRRRKESDQLI